jgi:hypothetical protein
MAPWIGQKSIPIQQPSYHLALYSQKDSHYHKTQKNSYLYSTIGLGVFEKLWWTEHVAEYVYCKLIALVNMYVIIISLIALFIYLFIYDCCIGTEVIILYMLTTTVVGNKCILINISIANKMYII